MELHNFFLKKGKDPAFNILVLSKVPLDKTSPQRLFMAGILADLGFFIAFTYSLCIKREGTAVV